MQTKEVEAPIELPKDDMDDMIEALVTNTMPTDTKIGHSRVQDPKEQFMRDACKALLY